MLKGDLAVGNASFKQCGVRRWQNAIKLDNDKFGYELKAWAVT